MTTILVVDDDPSIRSVVSRGLRFEGYDVQIAGDGLEALRIAREMPLHMVVLDVMLPNLDGLEVCRRLRRGSNAPIIMLTARDAVPDRIAGLDSGADDYLIKPFDFDELLARIRALLRRRDAGTGTVLSWGDVTVDLAAREQGLLIYFLRNQGRVLSRTRIYEHVWADRHDGVSKTLEVHVMEL